MPPAGDFDPDTCQSVGSEDSGSEVSGSSSEDYEAESSSDDDVANDIDDISDDRESSELDEPFSELRIFDPELEIRKSSLMSEGSDERACSSLELQSASGATSDDARVEESAAGNGETPQNSESESGNSGGFGGEDSNSDEMPLPSDSCLEASQDFFSNSQAEDFAAPEAASKRSENFALKILGRVHERRQLRQKIPDPDDDDDFSDDESPETPEDPEPVHQKAVPAPEVSNAAVPAAIPKWKFPTPHVRNKVS